MTTFRIIITLLLFITGTTFGQTNPDTTKNKNYCSWTGCKLRPDDPLHFDPYFNGHLCENFNPEQVDFSKEYFDLRTKLYKRETNKLQQTRKFNFSPIWQTGNWDQNGVLGQNYQRIQFHINKVTKGKYPDTYLVFGKSKVNNNICEFKGQIQLLKVFLYDSCDFSEHKKCGELFGNYIFYEDSSQNHSGIFKGITECTFYIDSAGKQMQLDESDAIDDGYWNRSFIGTWTEYKTKQAKKCIWGDYRLPFTFDFDCGDGEMHVCDKYVNNGWQTFGDGSEYIPVGKDKLEIKNKWWLNPK